MGRAQRGREKEREAGRKGGTEEEGEAGGGRRKRNARRG